MPNPHTDARAALDAALAAADGVPCLDPDRRHLWLSEDADDALVARSLCRGCPVIEPCKDYRLKIRPSFGTWAGHTCYRSEGLDYD